MIVSSPWFWLQVIKIVGPVEMNILWENGGWNSQWITKCSFVGKVLMMINSARPRERLIRKMESDLKLY